jgi:hypothetical protein
MLSPLFNLAPLGGATLLQVYDNTPPSGSTDGPLPVCARKVIERATAAHAGLLRSGFFFLPRGRRRRHEDDSSAGPALAQEDLRPSAVHAPPRATATGLAPVRFRTFRGDLTHDNERARKII